MPNQNESGAAPGSAARDTSSRCNLCGSDDFEPLSDVGRGHETLNTVLCRRCGLAWSHPFPIDPFNYYQKDYRIRYKGIFQPKMKHIFRAAHVALSRFQIVKPYLKPGDRLLDIGSGGGEFLYMARSVGAEVTGIEPNEGYAAYSREQYGLNIINGFLQNTSVADNAYDVVTLWHVFEHMDDPMHVLNTVHPALAEGGRLVIEVPNVEATCQAPHNTFHTAHLYNFNHATLAKMAELAGFETLHNLTSGDGGNICRVFRKTAVPESGAEVNMGENYRRVRDRVRGHTSLEHYLSPYPYTRLLGRLNRWLVEKRAERNFTSGRDILEQILSRVG